MKGIRTLAASIKRGELSPVKLAEETLQRAERLNPRINAFITILRASALKEAEAAEKAIREGRYLGPLHGIPIAIKDLIGIKGVRLTAGSKILSGNVATQDATVVARLRAAGAVILGTTNLHEFASGVTSTNPFYGPVRNPWDLERIAGGSSGGSAAAVASDMAPAALGTDTSGSIRIPASLCGVVGLKPTYGRVSRDGVIPLAASFDTVGTLTSSCWDAGALLGAVAGKDIQDETTTQIPVPDYLAEIDEVSRGPRIGIPKHFFFDVMDSEVTKLFEIFLERLKQLGGVVVDVDIAEMDVVYDTWAAIRRAEAAAFHDQWYTQTPDMYGEDVRASLEKGREVTAVQYINALSRRLGIRERFLEAMRSVDFLAVPSTLTAAPKIGEEKTRVDSRELDVYSALSRLTLPFNVIGFPVLSLPMGLVRGLPVGVQLVARPFYEANLLRTGFSYETKSGFPQLPEF